MNIKLQYEMDFLAGIWYNDQLQMNHYSLHMSLLTGTTDSKSTNVAMDRLKYFVLAEMQNTVFINQAHQGVAEMMKSLGINITTLPGEPVDQLVGMMLYCKLNSIMENRMTVSALDINSVLGDSVWYRHDEEDSLGPFAYDGWWNSATTQHDTVDLEPVSDNVVKVTTQGWHDQGLEWDEVSQAPPTNTIVYVNFGRNDS